jgi:seryl-tRNA synthetase
MDMARQQVSLYLTVMDDRGNMGQLVPQWRQVEPGTESGIPPITLSERDAQRLAESLDHFSENRRRYERAREEAREYRSENSSHTTRVDELRNHNTTLQEESRNLRRHVAWLERELRDSNRERREYMAASHMIVSSPTTLG